MKNKFCYLPLLLLAITSGCVNQKNPTPAPEQAPQGTFNGKFTRYVRHLSGKVDSSATANLQLSMQPATGFKVTGDTATVHAGSYGGYSTNTQSAQILFNDVTNPPTINPPKTHLNGIYNYRYDGTTFQMAVFGPADTITYYYKFTKTGN